MALTSGNAVFSETRTLLIRTEFSGIAVKSLAGKEGWIGPQAQVPLHLKPSSGDTALSHSWVGSRIPAQRRRSTYETARGFSGPEFLKWVFRHLYELDPLYPVSSRKPSFIIAQLTLGFPFLSLLCPWEQGYKPITYWGQAGNEWSSRCDREWWGLAMWRHRAPFWKPCHRHFHSQVCYIAFAPGPPFLSADQQALPEAGPVLCSAACLPKRWAGHRTGFL